MQVVCVGGGPGGLYLAILLKRWIPGAQVTVYERNARGRTHGWGITYWDDLLDRLDRADPQSAARMREASVGWTGLSLLRRGRELHQPKAAGFGLSRHRQLEILGDRAAELGVDLRYETEIEDVSALDGADLVAACDGVGSGLRKAQEQVFRPQIAMGRNKYIWLGVKRRFEPFVFAFADTEAGPIWFYGYAYGNESTCVVECAPETWAGLGFDRLSPSVAADVLSGIFARELDGEALMPGESAWQSFRTVRNASWVSGRTVVLGDAAHTAHFSIGSGTKLALDDAIILASALRRDSDVPAALRAYEQARRPEVARIQATACASLAWFERVGRLTGLSDEEFFVLLLRRRSRLLAHTPPELFSFLHRASERAPFIRSLGREADRWRELLGSRAA